VSQRDGARLRELAGGGARASAWLPSYGRGDPSAALLWLMATSTIVVAALWGGADHQAFRRSRNKVCVLGGGGGGGGS
jgi:hypothetical protein